MYDMMDAEYFVACLYFIIIVIVLNFWLINLFVAVINEMFAKVREDSQHSAFTTATYVIHRFISTVFISLLIAQTLYWLMQTRVGGLSETIMLASLC